MREQLAWADGLFAVGTRLTATRFSLALKPVAIGAADVTSFVIQANSVREESCGGESLSNSPAVLQNGPGARSLCSHPPSFLVLTLSSGTGGEKEASVVPLLRKNVQLPLCCYFWPANCS